MAEQQPRNWKDISTYTALIQGVQWRALLRPALDSCFKSEQFWVQLAAQPPKTDQVLRQFVLPLAAIAPIANYLKMVLFGEAAIPVGRVRWGIIQGIGSALWLYLMAIASVLVTAAVIKVVADRLGAKDSFSRVLAFTAHAFSPAYLAGALNLIPGLGALPALAGLYGLVLFWRFIPLLQGVDSSKRAVLFSTSLAISFAAMALVSYCSLTVMK